MARNFNIKNFAKTIIFALVIIFLITMCTYYDCGLTNLDQSLVTMGPKFIIVLFLFLSIKIVTSSIKLFIEKREEGKDDFKLIRPMNFIRYGIWIIFIFVSASIFFEDIGAILTSLGLIGFGVTFALQKPILNFVGWLNINLNRPFKIGDRIKIGEFLGDVVEIKMMHTVIKSLLVEADRQSGKMLSVPNEMVLVEPVENYTKDDNFIKTELSVSITYESDWKKSKEVFEKIVQNVTKRNMHRFRKNLTKRISFIDDTIEKLSDRFQKTQKKDREKKLKEHIDKLEKEKEDIKEVFDEMPSWFRPEIHVDLKESCISLLAIFAIPFDMIRTVKTEINSAFLDAVRKENGIEIAYPHLQLVTRGLHRSRNRNIGDFLGIDNINLKRDQSE